MDTQRALTRSRWINTALHILIVVSVAAGFAAYSWAAALPRRADAQQTIVIGQTRFAPDSDGSLRVVVQNVSGGAPVANAHVSVRLEPSQGRAIELYQGTTDESGSLPVAFHVPADAPEEATLVVETRSAAGNDRVEQGVTIATNADGTAAMPARPSGIAGRGRLLNSGRRGT